MGFYFDKEEWLRTAERLTRMGVNPNYALRLAAMNASHWGSRNTSTDSQGKEQTQTHEKNEEDVKLPDQFSISVTKISYQSKDEFSQSTSSAAEFELSKAKRAKAYLSIGEAPKESKVTAIIEFHGNGLTLTRVEGDCDTEQVGNFLAIVHETLYPERGKGLKLITRMENGKECLYSLQDPSQFSDLLHLMKTLGDKQVVIER